MQAAIRDRSNKQNSRLKHTCFMLGMQVRNIMVSFHDIRINYVIFASFFKLITNKYQDFSSLHVGSTWREDEQV